MSKILLYIDEDSMDEDFVEALKARNVDVLTLFYQRRRVRIKKKPCNR
jgi:hypothetical protein